MATQSDDLAAFIEALGLAPVHVVGWSDGGQVSLLAAVEHPELFRSLALYEPAFDSILTTEEGQAVLSEFNAAFGPAFESVGAGDLDLGVEQVLDTVWERPGAFDALPPEVQQVVLDNGHTLTRTYETPPPVSCEMLGALDTPTLLMVGENTGLRYFTFLVEEVAKCMPNAETVTTPGATHDGPVMAADAVNAEIVRFLSAN